MPTERVFKIATLGGLCLKDNLILAALRLAFGQRVDTVTDITDKIRAMEATDEQRADARVDADIESNFPH